MNILEKEFITGNVAYFDIFVDSFLEEQNKILKSMRTGAVYFVEKKTENSYIINKSDSLALKIASGLSDIDYKITITLEKNESPKVPQANFGNIDAGTSQLIRYNPTNKMIVTAPAMSMQMLTKIWVKMFLESNLSIDSPAFLKDFMEKINEVRDGEYSNKIDKIFIDSLNFKEKIAQKLTFATGEKVEQLFKLTKALNKKTALITGSSRGIGKAVALKLASLGCDIIVNYTKNQKAAEETVLELETKGVKAYALQCDIGDPEQIKYMFGKIQERSGKLDILVNNAAFGALGNSMKIGKMTWNMTMNINTTGLLLCTQQAVKLMFDGGKIVNLSSLGSTFCIPDYMAIGSAKAAVETMTKYLACDLIEKNIRVNAVSAGFIDTDALNYFTDIDAMKELAIKRTPAGRLGKPEDVAEVVAFLCQKESDWIMGQTLVADGGFSLKF